MPLNDNEIKALCESVDRPMITPFEPTKKNTLNGRKCPSFGTSHYGYDVRLGSTLKIATGECFDLLNLDSMTYEDVETDGYILKPGGMVLGHTLEYIRMPQDIIAICLNKSTLARTGLLINACPLEPEWHGLVTLELSNTGDKEIKLYSGIGVLQVIFFRGDPPSKGYGEGKYQGQTEITVAKN